MNIIDGKTVSRLSFERTTSAVQRLRDRDISPCLAVVVVGDDPASHVYVNSKVKRSNALGIGSQKFAMPHETTQQELLDRVRALCEDDAVDGILVQSPPPAHIDERAIIEAMDPAKDVDCFHPYNAGKLAIGDTDGLLPCTPAGVIELLAHYEIETSGKHAVVIGRSNLVGKPLAQLLARKHPQGNATVSLCHSRTPDLAAFTRSADIVIAAVGCPGMVTGDMIKPGAVLIDVGINKIDAPETKKGYRLVGDIDEASVTEKAGWLTPVPGGVGPMTIAMLMRNTVVAACRRRGVAIEDICY